MKLVSSIILALLSFLMSNHGLVGNQIDGNQQVKSFRKAKKLLRELYQPRQLTFYCGCPYENSRVFLRLCEYEPLKNSDRAKRLEWEHIVPAYRPGRTFRAWRHGHKKCTIGSGRKGKKYKGRKCLRKVSPEFRSIEADLYNLVPAIGEVNGLRSNYPMGIIPGELRMFGACDIEIRNHTVEPRPEIRGDIARIYFYMAAAYPNRIRLAQEEKTLFRAWDRADPVDDWELYRANKIEEIQGNANPFVLTGIP